MSNYNDSDHSGPSPEDAGLESGNANHGKEACKAAPADGSQPNWLWLQHRLSPSSAAPFEAWLDGELVELEICYAELITPRSRNRDLCQQFAKERR